MVPTGKIIKNKIQEEQLSAGDKNLKTAVSCTAVDNRRIDLVIEDFKPLTGGVNDRMSGWYAGKIRKLGVEKFIALARQAQQEGDNPAKLFSYLLKNN